MRKLILLSGLIGVFTCATWWGFSSYLKTGWRLTAERWNDSVPIEFQIERLRDMVDGLQKDVRKQYLVVAKEQVDVENVRQEVEHKEAELAREKQELKVLSRLLQSPKQEFMIQTRTYPRIDVEEDVRSRFDQFKLDEENLASLREILASREGCLEAAQGKLRSFAVDRRKLESRIEQLRLRAKRLAATEAAPQIRIDGSGLAEVEKLTADLDARLKALETLAQAEVNPTGRIPVELPPDESVPNIADQVLAHFGEELEVATTR